MPKTIGIVGSRRRDTDHDFLLVQAAFKKVFNDGDHIVSGGCPRGFAEVLAKAEQCSITIHYANWNRDGKIAGFARNSQCDVLIACVAPDRTGGTEDTVKKALKLGKQVIYV